MGKVNKKGWANEFRISKNKVETLEKYVTTQLAIISAIAKSKSVEPMILIDEIVRKSNVLALDFEFKKGYRLAKNWFACVLASNIRDHNNLQTHKRMADMFMALGLDMNKSLHPVPTYLEDTIVIDGLDNGIKITTVLILEPVDEFPIGSVWVSSSDKKWKVIDNNKDIKFISMGATDRKLSVDRLNARKMRRIV